MKTLNERLLDAWLQLSIAVSNTRIVSDMPYNEALLCNLLYKNKITRPASGVTAADLCRQSKMLKSQMNRTLNSMEEKHIILRKRSSLDKRQVFITLNEDCNLYQAQHDKNLELIGALASRIGTEKSEEILEMLTLIANTANEVLK